MLWLWNSGEKVASEKTKGGFSHWKDVDEAGDPLHGHLLAGDLPHRHQPWVAEREGGGWERFNLQVIFWEKCKNLRSRPTRAINEQGRVKMFRGGGLGSYTALPFCLPMLYSRLLPPHGIWVSNYYHHQPHNLHYYSSIFISFQAFQSQKKCRYYRLI